MYGTTNLPKLLALAAVLSLPAVAASASTVFEITDNPGGQLLPNETVADGGTYSTQLQPFDSLSINVDSEGQNTSGSLLFTFGPSPLNVRLSVILSSVDFGIFGDTTVTLSDGINIFSDIVTSAGQEVNVYGLSVFSPVQVSFDWTNLADGSFNADLSLTPVPVPAAGLLMLGAFGGLAMVKRKKKA
jgi:hypothetical protein